MTFLCIDMLYLFQSHNIDTMVKTIKVIKVWMTICDHRAVKLCLKSIALYVHDTSLPFNFEYGMP